MSTENEKNPIENRKELTDEAVDQVTGGALGFNPDNNGTYTMTCRYEGAPINNVNASAAAAFDASVAPAGAATAPTPEDEILKELIQNRYIEK